MGTQLAGEGKSWQRRVPGWRAVEVVCDGGEQAMTRGQKTVYTWPVHFSYYTHFLTNYTHNMLSQHSRRDAWLTRLGALGSMSTANGRWSPHDWRSIVLSSELAHSSAEVLEAALRTKASVYTKALQLHDYVPEKITTLNNLMAS